MVVVRCVSDESFMIRVRYLVAANDTHPHAWQRTMRGKTIVLENVLNFSKLIDSAVQSITHYCSRIFQVMNEKIIERSG